MTTKVDREREIKAEDQLVSVFLKEEKVDKTARLSFLAAVLGHVLLLVIVFPSWGGVMAPQERESIVYTIRPYTPPPKTEIKRKIQPVERVKKIPLPDPTPDEPEPIREPDPEPEPPPMPENVKVLFGMPKGPPAPQPVRVGTAGITELKRIKYVVPIYPILAKKAEVEGLVVLDVYVDEQGMIGDIKVMKSMPMGLTDEAVKAVRQWEYEPARQYGRAVPAWMIVKVDFRLK